MISKNILYFYLKSFFTYWLLFSSMLLSFETLLDYIKELKLLSASYTHADLLWYLSKSLPFHLIELAPLSIFVGLVYTNWHWTQHRLWLAYSVVGTSRAQFIVTFLFQVTLLLAITTPVYWFYGPQLRYDAAYQRMKLLGLQPEIALEHHYLQNQIMFYPMANNQIFIFDFSTGQSQVDHWAMADENTLVTSTHRLNLQDEQNALLGYNKLNIIDRYKKYKESSLDPIRLEELKTSLIDAIIYPFLVILGISLAWVVSPIQAIKRHASLSSLQFVLSAMVLYGGQKILGLAARFLSSKVLAVSYGGLIVLIILAGRWRGLSRQ